MTNPEPATTPPTRKQISPLGVVLFVLGTVAFLAVSFVMFLYAYPSFPNAGPQSDLRVPVAVVFIALVVLTFLGRAGRSFVAGFAAGFGGVLVSSKLSSALPFFALALMGSCAEMWINPEGTKVRQERSERSLAEHQKNYVVRERVKWIDSLHKRGLDEALGTRDALVAIDCSIAFRVEHRQFPPAAAGVPAVPKCADWLAGLQTDDKGWRMSYRPVVKGDAPINLFDIVMTPDTVLYLDGPVIAINQSGLVTMRVNRAAPAFARASPLPFITEWVIPCLGANIAAFSRAGEKALTFAELRDSKIMCTLSSLSGTRENPDQSLRDNPNAAEIVVTAPGFELYNTSAVYDLLYVMHGTKQGEGYDLYSWPREYGLSGVRSYLLASDGSIHVTAEKRRATLSDPLALECEWDVKVPC